MSADLVSKFVRAFYATDRTDTRAEGICISYCDAPTITIQTISGEHVHWRADLSEPADEFAELRADMDRAIDHLSTMYGLGAHSAETDARGAWLVYEYDHGPYAISLHESAEEAARAAARQGYGKVGFWAFGTDMADAVKMWESPEVTS